MSINKYIENAQVIKELNELKRHFEETPLQVSDITDEHGYQYVDLVQEGGGVLGIALLGFTYALEEAGIRFFSLAGTSAGAINTAFLAAAGKPQEKKSARILEVIDRKDLMDFVDGGKDAKRLVKAISKGGNTRKVLLTALNQVDEFFIRKDLGINRGDNFLNWLKEVFTEFGVYTTKALLDNMNDFSEPLIESAYRRFGFLTEKEFKARLSLIASDITTQTKAELPDMGDLYYHKPLDVNPAYYVRSSMSIPIFFDPLVVEDIPSGKNQVEKWQSLKKAYYFGNIPSKVVFVDGGVMSNFPIDVFHVSERIPTRPTFGVKLGIDRESEMKNDSIFQIIWNCFSAARQMRDHDVIMKNQDFISLTSNIDDNGINWLNFNLPEEDKVELFIRGVVAACAFLKIFDWEKYKSLRNAIKDSLVEHDYDKKTQTYAEAFILKK